MNYKKALNEIREAISDFDEAEEQEGYLRAGDKQYPIGYPYSDTKEKLLLTKIKEILCGLNKL
jgi:hypothetical protein